MWNSAPATPSARHRSLPEVSPPIQKRTCPQSDLPEEKKLQADSTQLKKQDTLGTRHGYIIEWSTVGLRVFVSTLIVFNYVIYIYILLYIILYIYTLYIYTYIVYTYIYIHML